MGSVKGGEFFGYVGDINFSKRDWERREESV
jgi:hypothetical protein